MHSHAHGRFFFRLASNTIFESDLDKITHLKNSTLAFPLIFLQIFIFHNVTITVPENFTQCTTHGSFVKHWQETVYNMFTFVCLFLLPLVIMIFCYTRILVEISSRMARNNCTSVCFWFRSNLSTLIFIHSRWMCSETTLVAMDTRDGVNSKGSTGKRERAAKKEPSIHFQYQLHPKSTVVRSAGAVIREWGDTWTSDQ